MPGLYRKPSTVAGFLLAFALTGIILWVLGKVPHHGQAPPQSMLAIKGVHIFNGISGKLKRDRTLLILGERIWNDQPSSASIPPDYSLLEADGSVVVPALIELAAYLSLEGRLPENSREASLAETLRAQRLAGVGTVLDLNTSRPTQRDYQRREPWQLLPTVLFAGPIYTGPGGWYPPGRTPWEINMAELTSPEEVDAFWRTHVTFNWDLCFVTLKHHGKDRPALNMSLLRQLASRARSKDIPLIIYTATRHKIDLALQVKPDILIGLPLDEVLDDALLRKMKSSGTLWLPVLGTVLNLWPAREINQEIKPYTDLVPPDRATLSSVTNLWATKKFVREHDLDGTNQALMIENVRRAHEAGVAIGAGSMAGLAGVFHGSGIHREMDWLVEAGLSPSEVLMAVTSRAAAAAHLWDRGEIRSGMRADLLLLDGDPTTNPQAHLKIRARIIGGRIVNGDVAK